MNKENKNTLYENIMKDVARIIKKHLNEFSVTNDIVPNQILNY